MTKMTTSLRKQNGKPARLIVLFISSVLLKNESFLIYIIAYPKSRVFLHFELVYLPLTQLCNLVGQNFKSLLSRFFGIWDF